MKRIVEKDFIVFDNMFTLGNVTRVSTSGLFLSRTPYQTHLGMNDQVTPEDKELFYQKMRSGEFASMPDEFRKNGYISEQIGNSGFTIDLNSTGADYGFDTSYEFAANPYNSYGISRRLADFLAENSNREFFLYVHYNTTHTPYYAPMKYYLKGLAGAPFDALWRPPFVATISYADDVFQNIYDSLKSKGLLENTIVVVATDHGASYDLTRWGWGYMYNHLTRMTFFLHLPPALKQQRGITASRTGIFTSSIDTAPTLADLAGFSPAKAFQGKSMLPILNGSFTQMAFTSPVWSVGRKMFSFIENGRYKYVMTLPDAKTLYQKKYILFGAAREKPFEEIYDLETDPGESHNLALARPDLLHHMRTIYSAEDVHLPERTVLSFTAPKGEQHRITVTVSGKGAISSMHVLTSRLKAAKNPAVITISPAGASASFILKDEPLCCVFEQVHDRDALSILITVDGVALGSNRICGTVLDLTVFDNPLHLVKPDDFRVLNTAKMPLADGWNGDGNPGVSVKISRIDMQRWIEASDDPLAGLNAGMKETLKAWGYIQ